MVENTKTLRTKTCSCGAPIHFIRTVDGKNMPCETKCVTITTTGGYVHTGYASHWASCPNAQNFKKKGREPR